MVYLGANNLYGWAMLQSLPTSNLQGLDVTMILDDSSRGYILNCDLDKCYFYYFYVHVYFMKWNVLFLHIS